LTWRLIREKLREISAAKYNKVWQSEGCDICANIIAEDFNMNKYIFSESNGLWYEHQGDYYFPCLSLPEEEEQPIGLWGQRHLRYIKAHRKALYTSLQLSGRMNNICEAAEEIVYSELVLV